MWTIRQAEEFKSLIENSSVEWDNTFDRMNSYGGSFIKCLRELYFASDEANKIRTLMTFGEYFDRYRRMK